MDIYTQYSTLKIQIYRRMVEEYLFLDQKPSPCMCIMAPQLVPTKG